MTYTEYKTNFIRKHSKSDWRVETSAMDENGKYYKLYIFDDGAQMTEVNEPFYEEVEVEFEARGIKFKKTETVKLFRTECWNTDDSHSYFFYEKF